MPGCVRRNPRSVGSVFAVALVLLTAALIPSVAQARTQVLPTIYVNYNDYCVFTVVGDNNGPVTSVPPGTYQIQVNTPEPFAGLYTPGGGDDYGCGNASSVDFQISGPGGAIWATNLANGNNDEDQATVTLLPSSTYTLVDLSNAAATTTTFTTEASGAPTNPSMPAESDESAATTAGTTSTAMIGAITATVSTHGVVRMTYAGRSVKILKEGRYRITVTDNSRTNGFILQKLDEPYQVLTPVGAMGTRTMTITLQPGQWLFYPRIMARQGVVSKKSWFSVIS